MRDGVKFTDDQLALLGAALDLLRDQRASDAAKARSDANKNRGFGFENTASAMGARADGLTAQVVEIDAIAALLAGQV